MPRNASWLSYERPPEPRTQIPTPRWRGQTQRWPLVRLRDDDDEINIDTEYLNSRLGDGCVQNKRSNRSCPSNMTCTNSEGVHTLSTTLSIKSSHPRQHSLCTWRTVRTPDRRYGARNRSPSGVPSAPATEAAGVGLSFAQVLPLSASRGAQNAGGLPRRGAVRRSGMKAPIVRLTSLAHGGCAARISCGLLHRSPSAISI